MRRFHPNPGMERALASTPEMRRHLERVVDIGAEEVRRRAPVASGALRESINGEVVLTPDGYEGQVKAGDRKAWYYWIVEVRQTPYFRSGVQAALSRFGGRLTSGRNVE